MLNEQLQTQTFFCYFQLEVLLKRPQRDKKVQMFPQFNRAQHFLKYCNHGNPMLLRFAAAQRCDLDTWRTLTFSLCKTVNCVCSQTPRQTQAGRRRVQRFELWNVTVQARRTKPTKQSRSGAHNPPPSRLFFNTDSSHRIFYLLLSFISLAAF